MSSGSPNRPSGMRFKRLFFSSSFGNNSTSIGVRFGPGQIALTRIPLGRFGLPEDIVYAALYLASDESSWTTGTEFVVDGGITVNYF